MCQRQTVKLTLSHKELIELASEKVQGIGNWKVVGTCATASAGHGHDYRSIDLSVNGSVTINLTLEAPAIC